MSKKKPVKSRNKNSRGAAKAVQSQYHTLNRQVKANLEVMGLDPKEIQFIDNPDKIKMSAVVLEFIDPYLQSLEGDEVRIRKILSLAIFIWNLSLLPQDEQTALENQLMNRFFPEGGDAKDLAAMIQLVETLKERKRKLFPGIRKHILGYDLIINNKNMSLQVSSQPLKDETKATGQPRQQKEI
ncbi:MAG: hypothetical protein WA081_03615 [Desulfosalsimonadaceae bacterium]